MDRQRRSNIDFAVIGLGFGDEGKGLTVNALCRELTDPIVVRYSGGQQAGHTVTLRDGTRHVFSNFGSGTLQGAKTYWSPFCTVDPVGIRREWEILHKKTERHPILFIDRHCPITTPFEKSYNRNFSKAMNHGTCGVGVGATYKREQANVSLLAGDLKFPKIVQMKLEMISKYYIDKCGMAMISPADLDNFERSVKFLLETPNLFICDEMPNSLCYIYEGSQGLLLDQNIGFFPNVTPSNTGTKNILELTNRRPYLYLVTRAFQTRHGSGPMTNENLPHNITENPAETNIENNFQGTFRRTLLDLDLLKYGIDRDDYARDTKQKTLVVTCMDLVQNDLRFTVGGQIVICDNTYDFLKAISTYLDIPEVMACAGPEGEFETFNFAVEDKYLGEYG
jgi:adenylosuccinate synthase